MAFKADEADMSIEEAPIFREKLVRKTKGGGL